jgi:hypothetical protein
VSANAFSNLFMFLNDECLDDERQVFNSRILVAALSSAQDLTFDVS